MHTRNLLLSNLIRKLLVPAVVIMFVVGRAVVPALSAPTTVTVNDVTDLSDATPGDGVCDTSGGVPGDQCSLRAAIQELNALGPDVSPHTINFNILGTGPFTIAPLTPLPAIEVPVEILGTSQPGTTCPGPTSLANLQIVLDGSSAGPGAIGLLLNPGSDGSTLRGLVIGNFSSYGIRVLSAQNIIRCNYVGIEADGVSPMGNGSNGILINSDNNIVGGQAAHVQRNVIAANGGFGIRLETASGNIVRNNFIGTTADGMNALGNISGMYVLGDSNLIGGTDPLAGNLISGNAGYGLRLNSANSNIVRGNFIGLAKDGVSSLPNTSDGIQVLGSSTANLIGGTLTGQANRIAYNEGTGITLSGNISGDPIQNQLTGNAIHDNLGLGINLGITGVDLNDPGDLDVGPNELQNYPVLLGTTSSQILTVTLDSLANTLFFIHLYRNDSCDPTGFGEGQEFVIDLTAATDSSGRLSLQIDLAGLASPGDFITATATDPAGNTSEFSNCEVSGTAPTPTPTATGSPTATPTATSSPTLTATPTPTPTPTATQPGEPTATYTPTASPTSPFPPEGTPTPPSNFVYIPVIEFQTSAPQPEPPGPDFELPKP